MMESAAVAQLADRIIRSGNRASSPVIVGWLVTTRCQLNCRHCWVTRNQPQASQAERERIARRLAESNICRLSLSGGEVTLLPDLQNIISILKSTHTPICIYTNAINPPGVGSDSWLKLWDFETDYVQVSLDGGNAREFEGQRGKDTFTSFLEGVQLLHRLGVRTMAHFVATPFNGGSVHSAAKLASELGCAGFSAELFYPEGKAASISYNVAQKTAMDFNASMEQMLLDIQLMNGPMEIGVAIPVMAPFPSFLQQHKPANVRPLRTPMKNGAIHCFVTPAGKVVPFNHLDPNEDLACGSLLEQDLDEIWKNGPGFTDSPEYRDLSNTRCAACPDFWFCGGGREDRAYGFYGTYNAPDPYCHRIRLSLRESR
ncbi:MAG: radical SAM protein [Syntrophorhabdaceae bacterium]